MSENPTGTSGKAQADLDSNLPPLGEGKDCPSATCPGRNGGFEICYGLAGGGGLGVYEWCSECEQVVSKTPEEYLL